MLMTAPVASLVNWVPAPALVNSAPIIFWTVPVRLWKKAPSVFEILVPMPELDRLPVLLMVAPAVPSAVIAPWLMLLSVPLFCSVLPSWTEIAPLVALGVFWPSLLSVAPASLVKVVLGTPPMSMAHWFR